MLRSAPQVCSPATSREGLAIDGEHIRALRSLHLPDPFVDIEMLVGNEAVRLFVDRAQAVDSSFVLDASSGEAVGELCRRLDGVPLVIELAAARIVAMSPAEIATRLDERFRLLTGGRRVQSVAPDPSRHRRLVVLAVFAHRSACVRSARRLRRVLRCIWRRGGGDR